MANLLKAQAIGRLTRDPKPGDDKESGGIYCLLSIAVNRKSGNDEETTYVDVSVRGKQAETCAEQLSQGDEIYVDGNLALREFEKKDRTWDKVLKINASTVQFINVKKWSDGGGNGGRHHDDHDDGGRGRGGNGSRYTRSSSNGGGASRTRSRYS
jgi:single-strand DNA-binding protein